MHACLAPGDARHHEAMALPPPNQRCPRCGRASPMPDWTEPAPWKLVCPECGETVESSDVVTVLTTIRTDRLEEGR